MRAAPVGVLYPSSSLDELIRGAYECAIPTHGGQMAVCAAAAVAAAVSAALDGRSGAEVLTIAVRAAKAAESRRPDGEAWIAAIHEVYSDPAKRKRLTVDEVTDEYFPSKPRTIVPLAIGLALVTESAQQTALLAASIGGDADSLASIGSAIAGALHPETVNEKWYEAVDLINGSELIDTVTSLAALRHNR